MKRILVFVYGLLCYLMFLAVFLYLMAFVGNFIVPKSLDSPAQGPLWLALIVNTVLIAIFGLQHSIMARPAFKRWWTSYVPEATERSTFVLFSNLALMAMMYFWLPMGGALWSFESPIAKGVMYGLCICGWSMVLMSTFLINHFDLFGLRQVWLYLLGKPYTKLNFAVPILYRYVRHPLYLGFIMAFWSTPTMTLTHLLFAVSMTTYILIAIRFEERDLVEHHGQSYEEYRRRVPMIVPRLSRKSAVADVASETSST
jgi:protein-S-isoprenylcysteine O-methyltransferase Ste14